MNELTSEGIKELRNERMKAELILPIDNLRGKLENNGYYFRMYKGVQIVQRCPDRSKHDKTGAGISGKVGNVCFRTMKGTGKVYMSSLAQARKTQPSASEIEARERFARKARIVKVMRIAGSKMTVKELWKLAEQAL